MFLLIIIYGYAVVAGIMIYFIIRDRKYPNLFFGRFKNLSGIFVIVLAIGILTAFYSTLIEPFFLRTNKITLQIKNIEKIKIVFLADIQVGNHKKTSWVEKIVQKIESINPDLVIIGGDLIDNEGTSEDESKYLEPLKKLVARFPTYYILGNHEYGIGGAVRMRPEKYTGDRSQLLIDRMKTFGIPLLRNSLDCPEINKQKICIFGLDDIWKYSPEFSALNNWDKKTPLLLIAHNPDGVLSYPINLPPPALILSGHTHGGQIWMPFIGALGDAETILGTRYYRGLKYYDGIPIYITTGAGESGAPLRLFSPPEITVLEIQP